MFAKPGHHFRQKLRFSALDIDFHDIKNRQIKKPHGTCPRKGEDSGRFIVALGSIETAATLPKFLGQRRETPDSVHRTQGKIERRNPTRHIRPKIKEQPLISHGIRLEASDLRPEFGRKNRGRSDPSAYVAELDAGSNVRPDPRERFLFPAAEIRIHPKRAITRMHTNRETADGGYLASPPTHESSVGMRAQFAQEAHVTC